MPGIIPCPEGLTRGSEHHATQALVWNLKVELKAGNNSLVLDQRNATPAN
jgi:hypothetical protein